MNGSHNIETSHDARVMSDAEISAVSGAVVVCTVEKPILDIGWLRIDWVNCGGRRGIAVVIPPS